LTGYYAGQDIHIVDSLGIGDALLARLPATYDPEWMPGHLWRPIPGGYMDTVRLGRNVIDDPDLAAYYDKLSLIVSGPVWSRERWDAVLSMNTGEYDHLVDDEYYRYEAPLLYDPESLK